MAQLVVDDSLTAERPEARDGSRTTPREPMDVVLEAHVTQLRLLFTAWISHFGSGGQYIKESTMDRMDRTVCRTIFDLTVRDMKVRDALGRNQKVWEDLVLLLQKACPSLEVRSMPPPPPPDADATLLESGGAVGGSGGGSSSSSSVIVNHSASLLKDLQRLDNMLSIARNILTAGEKVQNLAAQSGFDREVCSIVNLCIKITARGYDGDGPPADEDKWQAVINGFKKLLITALQFLSNLVTLNERLKLMLWVELFDSNISNPYFNTQQAPFSHPPLAADDAPTQPPRESAGGHSTLAGGSAGSAASSTALPDALSGSMNVEQPINKVHYEGFLTYIAFAAETALRDLSAAGEPPSDADVYDSMRRLWDAMPQRETVKWQQKYDELRPQYQKTVMDYHNSSRQIFPRNLFNDLCGEVSSSQPQQRNGTATGDIFQPCTRPLQNGVSHGNNQLGLAQRSLFRPRAGERFVPAPGGDAHIDTPYRDLFKPPPIADSDFSMRCTADEGTQKLYEGKIQLLERLERSPSDRNRQGGPVSPTSPLQSPQSPIRDDDDDDGDDDEDEDLLAEDELDEDVDGEYEEDDGEEGIVDDDMEDEEILDGESIDDDDDDESSEEDYAIPGEDGRGLLTDVPLILGPNEIEVLPMIIMSGIVAPEGDLLPGKQVSEKERNTLLSMYTIRCHLLLAQENGRNLLRELLIFVAAWDLREEELYFKFMVKIMEAILVNGLMPFAYNAFKETKDIISPAQAVIMKLLTKIFSTRTGLLPPDATQPQDRAAADLVRYDIQIVHHLFTEFRTVIVPQICALVFLQGQIRFGAANLEDFPLNLWDMERMYEGVYQYLEFFAILTDHEAWKQHMAEWEVSSELTTLLRELEVAIPKRRITYSSLPLAQSDLPTHSDDHLLLSPRSEELADQLLASPHPPVADVRDLSPHPGPSPANGPVPVSVERPFDLNSPPQAAPAELPPPPPSTALPDPAAEALVIPHSPNGTPYSGAQAPIHDEPADFEWRNLKKLCVLVLSSLVWKNRRLQDQVRDFGGLTAILSCCQDDEHNPFVREHAIMCTRFLVENNETNTAMVNALDSGRTVDSVEAEYTPQVRDWRPLLEHEEAGPDRRRSELGNEMGQLAVPIEVLDQSGYETFMDAKGQVGLRRRGSPLSIDGESFVNADLAAVRQSLAANAALPSLPTSMLNAMRATFEAGLEGLRSADAGSKPPASASSSSAAAAAAAAGSAGLEDWAPMLAGGVFDPYKLANVTPEMAHELMSGSVAETFERIAREAKLAAQADAASSSGHDPVAAAPSLEDALAKDLPEWMQAIVKGANALSRQANRANRKA